MDLEPRLVRRYHQLVRSHMMTSDLLFDVDVTVALNTKANL